MSLNPELFDELSNRPVGPQVKVAKKAEIDEFRSEIQVNGNTASVEVRAEDANEGTALAYLEEEGLTPEDWEVTGFRKIKYGQGMESVRFTYRKVSEKATESDLSDDVLSRARSLIQAVQVAEVVRTDALDTYTILVADPQLGKKGTEEAVRNYKQGFLKHLAAIERLRSVGQIHIAWMGDETENVVGSYGNQPYTVELNRTQQLELDFELRVWAIKEALELGLPISASSVISNHGEWTRWGGKDVVTTKGDNASTYVGRQVKRLFEELNVPIDWHIGEDSTPGVVIELSGVKCYFTHGHIEKGKGGSVEIKTKNAIENQILGKTEELGDVRVWFTAHYHHFWSNTFADRTVWGCPALEAEKSSEYMLDQYGVWSPAGMLGMTVSNYYSQGWSNVNVF